MNFGTKMYQRMAQRSRDLRDYARLERMDDHLLKDIGVTRDEVRARQMRAGFFV